MKNLLLFFILGLTSCATIINQRHTEVDVYTSEPALVIVERDSIMTVENRASFIVKRQKTPVLITAITDSLTKQVTLKSKNSLAYNLNLWPLYGIGYFAEMDSPKRFTYPSSIYLDMTDSASEFLIYALPRRGELYINISMPHINSFLYQPPGMTGRKTNTGFLGFTAGLDFYYSNNRFINFSATIADDFDNIILPLDTEEEEESFLASYISLSHNHQIKRFSLGYGLSYSENLYYYKTYGVSMFGRFFSDQTIKYRAYGLIFPAQVQLTEHFHVGFIYRPTYIRINVDPKLKYEHLMSLTFSWKFRLSKS